MNYQLIYKAANSHEAHFIQGLLKRKLIKSQLLGENLSLAIGELPIEAGYRELKEETSIINAEFVSEYPEWLNYDIPLPLADNLWEGKYRGQTQKWLLFHFMGEDKEIDINTNHPEFKNWIWLDPALLPEKAISFKKDVYRKVNRVFIPIINNFNASNYN